MGNIDHNHVGARSLHVDRAFQIVAGRAHCGRDAQPSVFIARGKRMRPMLDQVFRCDQSEHVPSG